MENSEETVIDTNHRYDSKIRRDGNLPLIMHARVITGSGGGPDKTILNSPRFLSNYGYRSVCLYLRPPGDDGFETIRTRAAACDAELVEVDDKGPWDSGIVDRMHRICERLQVDLWHAHDYKTNLLGVLLRKKRPALKLLTTSHGWVERTWKTIVYHQVDRYTLRRYDHVIGVSPDIVAQCRRLGVEESRLTLIENAIDTHQYCRRQTIEEAKKKIGWPADRLLIGAVGRLSGEKGFDLLLRAVAQLVLLGHDVGLAIAGEGNEQGALEHLAGKLQLGDRVRLLGFQSELIPFYEAMDIYALSSHREGLPNVLLEAMAIEVPVVSTRVAGVPQLIDDGVNGLLTDIGEVGQLTKTLARLLEDNKLRRKLAENARETIEARYSFEIRMQKMAAIYDQLFEKVI